MHTWHQESARRYESASVYIDNTTHANTHLAIPDVAAVGRQLEVAIHMHRQGHVNRQRQEAESLACNVKYALAVAPQVCCNATPWLQ